MAVTQANIVGALPELSWRGFKVPCSAAPYEFSHTQVPLPYPYRDAEGHEWTGRNAIIFRATLFFLNTLQENLYPAGWNGYRNALFDGSAGDLEHPELGKIRARVLSGSVQLVAERRAGVVVEVTWTETVDDPDKDTTITGTPVTLQALAKQADWGCQKLGLTYPKIVDPPVTDLLGLAKSLEGQIFSASLKVNGLINQANGFVEQLQGSLDRTLATAAKLQATAKNAIIANPAVWQTRQALDGLQDEFAKILQLAQQAARPTATFVTPSSMSLDAVGRAVGNTVVELSQLNPSRLSSPSIPKDASITFFK